MVLLLLEVWKLLIGDNHCFYNSGTNCGGGASCTNNKFGDPGFINPDTGNYHIGLASAAIDQGIDAKVLTDIYREPRPLRFGCDIGADELPFPPVANFTGPTSSWIDDKVQFINTTIVTGTVSYSWDFGDGTTNSNTNPTHTYVSPGNYEVSLLATNNAGSSSANNNIVVYGPSFTSSNPDWLGQTTIFTNTSLTSGTATYLWSFGDGSNSSLENPIHKFSIPGEYPATLFLTKSVRSDVANNVVLVYGIPSVDFIASPLKGPLLLTVLFTDTTTTIPNGDPTISYVWDFGDGDTSILSNPVHTYWLTGTYTITLEGSNAGGSNILTRENFIEVL